VPIKISTSKELYSMLIRFVNAAGVKLEIIETGETTPYFSNLAGEIQSEEVFNVVYNGKKIFEIRYEKNRLSAAEYAGSIIREFIEKKDIIAETLDIYKEINLLYNFCEKIPYASELEEIADYILKEAHKKIRFDYGLITRRTANCGIGIICNKLFLPESSLLPPLMKLEEFIFLDKKADIINVFPDNGQLLINCPNSIIYSPLEYHNQIAGVIILGLNSGSDRFFTAQNLKLLKTLSSIFAAVIENVGFAQEQRNIFSQIIYSLIETVEKLDQSSNGHSAKVSELCVGLGKSIGLLNSQIVKLKLAALLHDIGKIGLKSDDYEKHPEFGCEILEHLTKLNDILPAILHHHENYDGSGFPSGLKENNIPLFSRIIAVTDGFDQLVKKYHCDIQTAFEKLKQYSRTKYDPEIIDALRIYLELP